MQSSLIDFVKSIDALEFRGFVRTRFRSTLSKPKNRPSLVVTSRIRRLRSMDPNDWYCPYSYIILR